MATGSAGGSGIPRRDPTWKHCILVDGNKNCIICNYCGLLMKSGDIAQFKFHLSHILQHEKCPRVFHEVKEDV